METNRYGPPGALGDAIARHAAVTENGDAEYDPLVLMNGAGLGRTNTISSEEIAPPAAHDHPPTPEKAQKSCMTTPLFRL